MEEGRSQIFSQFLPRYQAGPNKEGVCKPMNLLKSFLQVCEAVPWYQQGLIAPHQQ